MISLIVALDRNGLIGQNNRLPWHLPADLRHFKQITMGKTIIMGRRTCESIGRPLPGRRNVVLTRNSLHTYPGFEVARDKEQLLASLQPNDESVVIGGSEIYRLFWPNICRMYITLVEGEFSGDTWFPEWPLGSEWSQKESIFLPRNDQNPFDLTFLRFEKVEKK